MMLRNIIRSKYNKMSTTGSMRSCAVLDKEMIPIDSRV